MRTDHSADGWSSKTLRDLATINYGRSPKEILAEGGPYPVVGTGGAERYGNGFLYDGESVVLGRKGTIERVYFATGRFWTIDTAYYLSDFDDTLPRWLYYVLQNMDLRQLNEATGVPSLSRDRLYQIEIGKPPKLEQCKIAEILSTVDRAIGQTESLIAKQQRIKTGLMQDLLTRGIDEQGNLRSEETHQFKNSPLGRIPVEWDVSELASVLAELPRNGIFKPANQIGSGTVLIGQTSFTKERRIDYRFARRAIVSAGELRAYELRNHDILVTRVFATVDGVGLPVLVTDLPEAAVYESNMLRLRVDSAKYSPAILFHWLRSSAIRKRVAASVNASNQTSINQTVLNALPVLVIPGDEQDNIVAAVSAQETYFKDLSQELGKLRSLKTAMMQDLLTGEKRVTPLLEPAGATQNTE